MHESYLTLYWNILLSMNFFILSIQNRFFWNLEEKKDPKVGQKKIRPTWSVKHFSQNRTKFGHTLPNFFLPIRYCQFRTHTNFNILIGRTMLQIARTYTVPMLALTKEPIRHNIIHIYFLDLIWHGNNVFPEATIFDFTLQNADTGICTERTQKEHYSKWWCVEFLLCIVYAGSRKIYTPIFNQFIRIWPWVKVKIFNINPREYSVATLLGQGLRDEDYIRSYSNFIRSTVQQQEFPNLSFSPDDMIE